MFRQSASIILPFLLIISALALAFNVQLVKSDYAWTETIYIMADGSIQPSTAPISSVDGVTYTLTDNSVGNVAANSSAINIQRDNIIIDGAGYTLTGTRAPLSFGASVGIYLTGRSNVTIKNMIITAFSYGIELDSSSVNSVSGNNITANNDGGILLYYSSDNSVSGNNITNNGDGIYLYSSSNNNSVSGNNIIANYNDGIHLYSSNNNSVSGNNMTANSIYGIFLDSSSNDNSVSQNSLANNGNGIALGSSSGNSVSGNNITANEYYGIWLWNSSDNSVSGNSITARNLVGIYLDYLSNNNGASANNIANNLYGGIFLDSSSNNSIAENNIANDSEGIYLEDSSGNNSIFHNNFVNNTQQVVSSVGFTNMWDDGYPSGGNYWSDYNGPDSNVDGVGDTPYVIGANNTDRYPFMARYGMFDAGTWNGTACSVGVMSNSTVSMFQVDVAQKTIAFNVTGTEGSTGFCRATIPNAIVQDLWQGNYTVLVDGEPWPFRNWTDITNTYLYFNYTHSQHQTVIIPELPSLLTWPILMIAALLATIASRRKWPKHQASSRQHPRTASNK